MKTSTGVLTPLNPYASVHSRLSDHSAIEQLTAPLSQGAV